MTCCAGDQNLHLNVLVSPSVVAPSTVSLCDRQNADIYDVLNKIVYDVVVEKRGMLMWICIHVVL